MSTGGDENMTTFLSLTKTSLGDLKADIYVWIFVQHKFNRQD